MPAYSQDLRECVLRALDRGDGPTEITGRFRGQPHLGLSGCGGPSSGAACIGGYRRSWLAESEPALRDWIAAEPDLTLADCNFGWPNMAS